MPVVPQIWLLLVEDEPLIQLALQEALEDGGFSVVAVSNGDDALATLKERKGEIAGLMTDIRLGRGPDGWELARHARDFNPAIGVVYFSGDSAADWPALGVPKSLILQKPFAPVQLVTAISSLLNEGTSNLPHAEH